MMRQQVVVLLYRGIMRIYGVAYAMTSSARKQAISALGDGDYVTVHNAGQVPGTQCRKGQSVSTVREQSEGLNEAKDSWKKQHHRHVCVLCNNKESTSVVAIQNAHLSADQEDTD